jgi:hypothetical protein
MPFKSYIEPKDLRTDGYANISSMLKTIKYGELSQDEKPEVIVIKETFLLRNKMGNRLGVVTRSSKDHKSTVGDCSVLLHSDFIRDECSADNRGRLYYDVNDRLHEHFGSMSSLFRPAQSDKSLLIHYLNPRNKRRYIFVVFEMVCDDYPPPMFIKLKTRMDDAFVGFHDLKEVAVGIKKYNKTPIDVDENVFRVLKPKRFFQNKDSSILKGIEIKNSLISPSITLVTLQLHKFSRGSSGNGVEDRVAASLERCAGHHRR